MSVCDVPVYNMNDTGGGDHGNDTEEYEYDYVWDDYMDDYTENTVAMVMVKGVWPVVILAGTVGNIMTFMVLIRRRMRRTPVYFYLAMLACADTSVLYLSGFKTWLRVMTGIEILHLSDSMCKICMFCFLQSLHLSALFIVAITMDRFLTLWFPFNETSLCVIRKAKIMSLIFFVALLLYNVHVFWTIGLQEIDGYKMCNPLRENTFMCNIFPWLKLSLYTLVPFFIVFALNCATILKLFQAHAQFKRNNEIRSHRIKAGQYRVTIMLLGVSMSWLALTAPFTLYSFFSHRVIETARAQAREFLFKTVCFTLLYINHAINFYIYCLSGKRFRQELKEFMTSFRRWSFKSKRSSTYGVRALSGREINRQILAGPQRIIIQTSDERRKKLTVEL